MEHKENHLTIFIIEVSAVNNRHISSQAEINHKSLKDMLVI